MSNRKFDTWNEEKKGVEANEIPRFYVNERDIWFTKMGINIGFEEDGKKEFGRPVVVIKRVGNLYFTVALTTKGKANSRFYLPLTKNTYTKEDRNRRESSAILSQAKVMDKKRFMYKIGKVSQDEFITLKEKLTAFLL